MASMLDKIDIDTNNSTDDDSRPTIIGEKKRQKWNQC